MEIFAKVFKQTSWQVVGKLSSSIATIISLGIIWRAYGAEGTGVVTLALTYLAFFALAVDFGVNAYALPYLLKDNYILEWRKLFGFRLILATVLFFLALVLPSFFSPDPTFQRLIWLGSFFAIFEAAIFISTNAIFQAKLRYDLSTIAYCLGSLFELVLIFFLSLNHASLTDLILAYCGGWLIMSVLSLLLVKKFIPTPLPVFEAGYLITVLKRVWPIALTLILNTVYFRLDAFLISFFHSYFDVGIYNIAYSVFQSALFVPTFIMNSFYPLMIKNLEQGKDRFQKLLIRANLVMFVLGCLGTVATLILAPLVVGIITGGKTDSGSIESLRILSFGFPAYFLSSLALWTLVTLKKYKTVLLIYVVGLLANLILNWLFIPQYSYLAASWITGVAEYLILLLQMIILWKEFRK